MQSGNHALLPDASHEPEPVATSLRILVVDDEDTLRTVIAEVLRDDGRDVTEASSAEKALELFRADPFQVVITDIIMGKMNGLELLQEVKQISEDTQVIVMTSNVQTGDLEELIQRKGDYQKNKWEIRRKLREALLNRPTESSGDRPGREPFRFRPSLLRRWRMPCMTMSWKSSKCHSARTGCLSWCERRGAGGERREM